MKIQLDKHSFVEIQKDNDKIKIIIAAKDQNNNLKTIINAVEITEEQYKELISDVS